MTVTPNPAEGKRVFDLDRAYVFHSWSAQGSLNPLCVAATEGSYLWDYDGNRYLDAVSSWWVNVFGHANPRINQRIRDQLDQLRIFNQFRHRRGNGHRGGRRHGTAR